MENIRNSFAVIILARGGSKGIPRKNIRPFAGRSLLEVTHSQFQQAGLHDIFVSTDDDEIAARASSLGASIIERPLEISGDTASSESGWLHAIESLSSQGKSFQWIIGPQLTSPLREAKDIHAGMDIANSGIYDSIFSASLVTDVCIWEQTTKGLQSLTYDWSERKRRQDVAPKYLENGSFYIFRPEVLVAGHNRFGGKIGVALMEHWKSFEIDEPEDFELCEDIYQRRLANRIN